MTNAPINEVPPNGAGGQPLPAALVEPEVAGPREPASARFIVAYWLAQFGEWLAILTPVVVTIALRVGQIADPAEKAAQLGLVLGIGAFGALIAAPIWGEISDRTRWRFGRRKVWMAVGVVGLGFSLLGVSLAPNMLIFGIMWLLAQIFHNANQSALNALLPDQVPVEQRGRVSGLLGMTAIVAVLVGTFLTQFFAETPVLMFLAPWFICLLTTGYAMTSFRDRPAIEGHFERFSLRSFARTFWVSPRKFPDFGWAWLSRFLVIMGAAFLQTYTVFLFSDRLGVPTSQVPSLVFLNSLVGAAVTLIVLPISGYISDKIGRRKPFVFGTAIVGSLGFVVIGFATSVPLFFVGSVICQIGLGIYYAIDLALVAAVLPDPENSAKDMGVFQIAGSLPQSLAPAIAPVFLAIGGVATGNYFAVFMAAALFLLLGALAILPVRRVR